MQEPSDDPPPRYPRGLYLVAVVDVIIGAVLLVPSVLHGIIVSFGFLMTLLTWSTALLLLLISFIVWRLAVYYIDVARALFSKRKYSFYPLILTSFLNLLVGLILYLFFAYHTVKALIRRDECGITFSVFCSTLPILLLFSGYIGFSQRKRWQVENALKTDTFDNESSEQA